MKGVALIDGRSRPYFQGIERVLNSQQREALAQGVWQVLETIPDDFESFEFQFAGTQVYIHKLSQEQILLVLTHDNLIYPDYFDAFSRLRGAFNEDSGATMDAFQRLLGARNTKVTPLNLSDVANAEDEAPSPVETLGADGMGLDDSGEMASEEMDSGEPPTLEIPTLEIPSGSADYAVAADTEITDISTAAVEPDAPANPAQPEADDLPATILLDADDLPATVLLDADDNVDEAGLPDVSSTEAGLPDLGRADAGLPDFGAPEEAAPEVAETDTASQADDDNAAAMFAASLADANALVGRSVTTPELTTLNNAVASNEEAIELPSLGGDKAGAQSLPEVDSLLAVTQQPPAAQPADVAGSSAEEDPQADLAALVDTLSLGEEDFESQSGIGTSTDESAAVSGEAGITDAALPEMELAGDADRAEPVGLPDMGAEEAQVLNPWDEPDAAAAAVSEALAESQAAQSPGSAQNDASDEPLLAVTKPPSIDKQEPAGLGNEAAERSLNNRLDAVALDDDIEIDDLFGYEEPTADSAAPQASHAVLESYVESLNALGEFSAHYLGRAVIVNYWRTSRPADEWLQGAFAIERSANSIRLGPDYAASRRSPITDGQQVALQTWAGQFVSRCSKVIRDFPQLAQQSLDEDQSKMLDL